MKGVHVHARPNTGEYDSNYWLCTITIDENVRIKGQENAYKSIVTGAVGGAAGVIHAASSAVTDCLRNGVSEAIFKVGMCLPAGPYVSDEDVKYIVDTIKAEIV